MAVSGNQRVVYTSYVSITGKPEEEKLINGVPTPTRGPFADGWMGDAQARLGIYKLRFTIEKAGLHFLTGTLQSIKAKYGFIPDDLTNRRVRDPYARW